MDILETLTLNNTYEVQIVSRMNKNFNLFYTDESSKIRIRPNIYYPCINKQTQQKLTAQFIVLESNEIIKKQILVLEILKQNPHTNIIKIIDIIQKDNLKMVFTSQIAMNLEEFLQKNQNLSFNLKKSFFIQLLAGYKHLIRNKIILRDLQPQYISVWRIENDYILQISDFSSAEISQDGIISSQNGMSYFAAPETLSESNKIQESCCLFTLGMLLYYICNQGKQIYKVKNIEELKSQQKQFIQELNNDNNKGKDDIELRDLYRNMLQYEAKNRCKQTNDSYKQQYFLLDDVYFVKRNSQVGSGAQGVVVDAINIQTKEKLVCKIVDQEERTDDFLKQIKVYKQIEGFKHQNIIEIKKIIENPSYYFILLEKCEINVQQYLEQIKLLADDQILDFLSQIIQGYICLGRKNIIHRDIKPENIMIQKDQNNLNIYKIIDFGVSKIINVKDLAISDVGTYDYIAPEVFEQKENYDSKCDIFSIGAILHLMVFNKKFIDVGGDAVRLKEQHKKLQIKPFKCPKTNRSPDIISLIEAMVIYDPNKRIDWYQLHDYKISKNYLDILNHMCKMLKFAVDFEEFFQEINKKQMKNNKQLDKYKLIGISFQHSHLKYNNNQNTLQLKIQQKFQILNTKLSQISNFKIGKIRIKHGIILINQFLKNKIDYREKILLFLKKLKKLLIK